ncbi:MAG: prolyl oligopeptidase family serine peptidase [Gemmataceae bacterium]
MSPREAARRVMLLRHGTAVLLSLIVLVGLAGQPGVAQEDERAKEIREVEKKLDELKAKLASLKATDPTKGRQPLTIQDALAWKSITRTALSRDGKWFASAILPADGKGDVVVRATDTDKEHKVSGVEGVGNLAFSHDSKWLAVSSVPRRRGGGRPMVAGEEEPPVPGKVVLVNLASGDKAEYEGVKRFAFSGVQSNVLALHRAQAAAPTTPSQAPAVGPPAPPATRPAGTDLVLRDLTSGKVLTLGNVAEFGFDKEGGKLALLLDTQGQVGNGVQLRDMKSAALHQLEGGKASYEGLAWTEKGDAFTLLKGVEEKGQKRYTVLTCTDPAAPSPALAAIDPAGDAGFPKGLAVSRGRRPSLSDDREAILFGIAEPRKGDSSKGFGRGKRRDVISRGDVSKDEAAKADSARPDLVIWHWNDARLQSAQQMSEMADRGFTYLCAYRLKDKKFLRLGDDTAKNATAAPKQRFAIATDRRAYERSASLNGRQLQDVYVIDLRTGERYLALKGNRYLMGPSPDGAKFLYYDDGQFHVYDMPSRQGRCVTKAVPTSFIDAEDDHPVDRPPTRSMGWTKDGSAVLLSDNWDVWKVPVADGEAVNLTGNGKKEQVRYRSRVVFDEEEKGIDLDKPQVWSMYGEWTKKGGYVRIDPKGSPTVLAWDDAEYGGLAKARDADVYIHTRQTTTQYPDWYSTDAGLKSARRLTDANPQQGRYQFCSGAMLVNYESAKGDRLQGALYLPANYEKGKKYPTVVYIYEKLSQGKNRYQMPMLTGGGFNASLYTSNGYAVFNPDITYKLNDPGMSAVWCVLPALEAAIATGVVDRDRVGLQGHSWGGYQTAFLVTQTPAFKAAVAGAPLTDLISMYSSIYWNVGITNQQIFESSQGRFTSGYWDQPEAYIRNSPVFHARNVKTPLILLHNDKDGAVDFNQGVEYFNTLRRLDKPVVMLQYKGENHGLARQANMKDYTVRMREFFDHHLQGKAAPAWLKEGVPHLKMDDHLKERAEK